MFYIFGGEINFAVNYIALGFKLLIQILNKFDNYVQYKINTKTQHNQYIVY